MADVSTVAKVSADLFGTTLLDPEGGTPEGVIGPDGKPDAKRFNVYRNNVVASLCEALGDTYPAIKKLLGDEYFTALARAYVSQHPPECPVLIWFGGSFAEFIAAFPPLKPYPYLADVARLEWVWVQAYHAADAQVLDPTELGAIAPELLGGLGFVQHPAAAVVKSDWPIWDLFRVNRYDEEEQSEVDLSNSQSVLVTRPDFDVEVHLLAPAGDVFAASLFAGEKLDSAANSALQMSDDFNLSDCLSVFLSSGAFTGLCRAENA